VGLRNQPRTPHNYFNYLLDTTQARRASEAPGWRVGLV
jgi:hypothetical protein